MLLEKNVNLINLKKNEEYGMLRNKIIVSIVFLITIFEFIMINNSFATEAITVPETDINLKIENLISGCEVYILIPDELLKYNMTEFINYNTDNPYDLEDQEADKLREFLEKEDYVGYVEYFKELGFNQKVENRFELRHYCFAMGDEESDIIGDYEYNDVKYVQVSINLDDENQFQVVLKDYLASYDISDIKFMIDEYGTLTYINVGDYEITTNSEKTNIREANVTYSYCDIDEYNSTENAIKLTYLIIFIILILVLIFIITIIVKYYKAKKQEIEDRKFWKKKLTKDEIKAQKKKEKQEKKMKKINKNEK